MVRRLVLTLLIMGLWAPRARAADAAPYRVAAGANLGGGQIDWRINRKWMVELRAQGSKSNDEENTRASIIGFRGYRFFNAGRPMFFGGLEVAGVETKQQASGLRAGGFAVGAFGGMEFRLIPHLFLLIDAGPYVINLKEEQTGITNSSVDFVADAALVVGF